MRLSQQMYMKIKNDNLIDFHNCTYSSKVQNQIKKYLLEQRLKHNNGLKNRMSPFVSVISWDKNFKDKVIKAIGANHPLDLINDNFGYLLAGIHHAPASATLTTVFVDDGGTNRNVNVEDTYMGGTGLFNQGGNIGTQIRLGSGVAAAAGSDYEIQTPLLTAPENTYIDSGSGSYVVSSSTVKVNTSFIAGANETIKETGLFGAWKDNGGTLRKFMLTHENISPTVSIFTGNSETVQYQWLI